MLLVPPSRRGDGFADLSYVYDAAKEIAEVINGYTVIVTKSTVPVGTGDEVEKIIRKFRADSDFSVVSNPEFLREGAAIDDFKRPDRIIVGLNEDRPKEVIRELYRPLYLNETPILFTKRRTSELIKYTANAFLATKITFINEIADLCEKLGADIQEVARGVGLDNRIGPKFLNAGPGYGGSCFPKDTLALMQTARKEEAPLSIVEAVVKANERRKKKMADKVIKALNHQVSGKKISILGLAFKPNTDDMRYAPSLDIIPALQKAGAEIHAYDPIAMEEAKKYLKNIKFFNDLYSSLEQADALVIITEWDNFRAMDLNRIKNLMRTPVIIDLRNIYSIEEMKNKGFEYTSIGRS